MKASLILAGCSLLLMAGCGPKFRDVIIPEPNRTEKLPGSWKVSPDQVSVRMTEDILGSPEGYDLTIAPEGVTIQAGSEAGVFYARQSLQQLQEAYGDRIPAQHITDAPRFKYRGVHMDVVRHFQDKEFVKKQLRMFASVKINTFHFHLTDGIGWRLQLDRYPELTERTAWKPAGFTFYTNDDTFVSADTPGAVGGFYTKDDIREILACADSLHITVIPEIEMFGHSTEVFEVFPDLTCPVENTGRRKPSEFCIGNDDTFTFLENVLDEVIELFPSQHIHIGGDEASMRNWAVCPRCAARMKAEGLTSVQELQSYGISRIERFVNSRGRTIIGWEEIAKGGLAPNAVLMSWRGVSEGQAAAAAGHEVVFCPEPYCYIDAYQDDPRTQPSAINNYVPSRMTYSFDPAEGDFAGKEHIRGVQCNLWTEFIEKPEHAEYMYYPRVFALAEVAWTQPANKDYENWKKRAIAYGERAVAKGYTVFDLRKELGPRPGSVEPVTHLAVGCPVTSRIALPENPMPGRSPQLEMLTDGRLGPWVNKYGGWVGIPGTETDLVVDLGAVKTVREVSTSFVCFGTRSGLFPQTVSFEGSTDGETFFPLGSQDGTIQPEEEERPYYQDYGWKGKTKARFIRLKARKDVAAPAPDADPRLSFRRNQMLLDEIIVR